MITTIHLLIGAVIGGYVKNIWLIILFALISHYVLDFIPHISPFEIKGYIKNGVSNKNAREVVLKSIEPLLGLILVSYLIFLNKEKSFLMILGAFFAWLPDLISYAGWINTKTNWVDKIVPRHGNIFYNQAKSLIIGILTQVIIFVPSVILLIPKKGGS